MFYVFIAESSAVLADSEAYSMAARFIIGTGVFGIESLDWISAFYADWHCIRVGVICDLDVMCGRTWCDVESLTALSRLFRAPGETRLEHGPLGALFVLPPIRPTSTHLLSSD
jgi:hypothetical protein